VQEIVAIFRIQIQAALTEQIVFVSLSNGQMMASESSGKNRRDVFGQFRGYVHLRRHQETPCLKETGSPPGKARSIKARSFVTVRSGPKDGITI
jgi:hypothetical protein